MIYQPLIYTIYMKIMITFNFSNFWDIYSLIFLNSFKLNFFSILLLSNVNGGSSYSPWLKFSLSLISNFSTFAVILFRTLNDTKFISFPLLFVIIVEESSSVSFWLIRFSCSWLIWVELELYLIYSILIVFDLFDFCCSWLIRFCSIWFWLSWLICFCCSWCRSKYYWYWETS